MRQFHKGVIAIAYVLLALYSSNTLAQDDGEPQAEDSEQQAQRQRIKLAPETQRLTLEAVSADCYDSVFQVLNGEAEQSSLSEACQKEMMQGYQNTPLGQLQRKESEVTQTAAALRLSAGCRSEFSASMAAAQAAQAAQDGGEEGAEQIPPMQPSETCVNEIQKHMRDMQQWVGAATVSKLSNECKKEAQSGDMTAECETEFLAAKPSILELLEKQNEQKAKEPVKEEKKKSTNETKKKRERPAKPAPPLIDPSLIFFVIWSVLIVGGLTYACMYYYKNENTLVETAPVVEEAKPKSKSQLKREAKEAKMEARMDTRKRQ